MAAVIRHASERYGEADSAWQLRKKAQAGEILRLRPGSYLITKEEQPEDFLPTRIHLAKIVATVSGLRGSVVARHSAALLHGLPIPYSLVPDQVIVHRHSGGHQSDWVHSFRMRHPAREITEMYGFPVTSLERTVRDLVRVLDPRDGLSILDAALRMGLEKSMINASSPAAGKLRSLLPIASARSESPLESRSRFLMHELGLPMPLEQVTVRDESGYTVGRLDFWWPGLGLVGEADGAMKYSALLRPDKSASDVILDERHREKRIQQLGNHVVRWGWGDTNRSGHFGRMLENGMRVAAEMPTPRGDYLQLPVDPLPQVDHSLQFEAVRFKGQPDAIGRVMHTGISRA